MKKWLQNYAYQIDMEIWIFITAGFAVLLTALLSVSYQAVRAAVADPVDTLRYE